MVHVDTSSFTHRIVKITLVVQNLHPPPFKKSLQMCSNNSQILLHNKFKWKGKNPLPLFLGDSSEDAIETDITYIMKFTPTNQVSNWIIDDCLSHHAQIPPLWLTQVKHIHEITKFSNQPSILFHLVLICRNTVLHLYHSLFWTHKTFNLLF